MSSGPQNAWAEELMRRENGEPEPESKPKLKSNNCHCNKGSNYCPNCGKKLKEN